MDEALEKFEENFKFFNNIQGQHGNKKKYVTLMIGTTGVGKTALSKFLFTDNMYLKSISIFDGADEYYIEDAENEICHEISSKTTVPKICCYKNFIYYDCPGFSDNRNSLIDIVSSMLIKQVVDNSDRVRLMVTVNYTSMKVAVDKLSFLLLVKHLNEFIKNIDLMENSIILAVTKIDKCNKDMESSDEILYREIIYFLTNVEKYLIEQINSCCDQDKIAFERHMQIVKILKKEENMVFFKRPIEPGPLNKIKLLQKNKKEIMKVLNKTPFVRLNETDLGFTVSGDSKIYIINMIQKILDKILSDINNSTSDIIKYYRRQIETTNNINQTIKLLRNYHEDLLNLISNLNMSSTYSDTIFYIIKYLNHLFLENTISLDILFRYKCIKFLEKIYSNKFEIKPVIWTENFRYILEEVTKLLSGTEFLMDFYESLEDYDKFISIRNLNSKNIDVILPKIDINTSYGNMSNIIKGNNCLTRHFQNIINAIPYDSIVMSGRKVTAMGNYICLSRVVEFLNAHQDKRIDKIVIYAFNVFFINVDFSRRTLLEMVIISPRWVVVGNRKIDLKGNPGVEHGENKAKIGEDGKPGLPGGSGCAFMGIAINVMNAGDLSIDICGGDGAPGQDGGDGLAGTDAKVILPSEGNNLQDGIKRINVSHKEERKETVNGSRWWYLTLCKKTFNKTFIKTIPGVKGSIGCDGRRGGKGGIGGISGELLLSFETEENGSIEIKNKVGRNGNDGKPGDGGLGGKNASTYELQYSEENVYLFNYFNVSNSGYNWVVDNVYYNGRYTSGKTTNELSTDGLIKPGQKNVIIYPWNYIIDYKECLLNNISEVDIDRSFDFLVHLSEGVTFNGKPPDLQNFIDDFNSLEEYSIKNKNINKLYTTFANAVIGFNKNQPLDESLVLIYTTILIKLSCSGYRKPKNCSLIETDYMKQGQDIIKKTKSLHMAIVKKETYTQGFTFGSYFTNNMNKKIKNLKHFYDNHNTKNTEIKLLNTENNLDKFCNIFNIKTCYASQTILFCIAFSEYLTEYIKTTNSDDKNSFFTYTKNLLSFKPTSNLTKLKDFYIKSSKCLSTFINDQDDLLKKLSKIETDLLTKLTKLILKLEPNIANIDNNIRTITYHIKIILTELKISINDLGFYVILSGSFLFDVESLEYELDILINIYDQFEYLDEQNKLYHYLSHMKNTVKNNRAGDTQKYNKILNKIILDQYYKLVGYFKEISFPFGNHLPPFLGQYDDDDFNTLSINIENRIDEMEKIIKDANMQYINLDVNNDIITRPFSDVQNGDVFYTWDKKLYDHSIANLLSGKEISLKSNVLKCNYDVLKFSAIGISLHADDDNINVVLIKYLKQFYARIIHMGNSYYRLNNKYYTIITNTTKFTYDLVKEPYTKLPGLPVLSPYATFNIKLKPHDSVTIPEDFINKYSKYIDLHLIGIGRYVDSNLTQNLFNENQIDSMYNLDTLNILHEVSY